MFSATPHQPTNRWLPPSVLVAVLGLFSVGNAFADEAGEEPGSHPLWSLHFRGGAFYPAIDNWKKYYDTAYMGYFSIAGDWWINRYFGVGAELGYMRDEGQGQLPVQEGVGGYVEHRLWPVSVLASARGAFRDDQVVIPYFSAGVTYLGYAQKIDNQERRTGSTIGAIAHLGVQFLLDPLDQRSASSLESNLGIRHSYFELDLTYINAPAEEIGGDSVDLGGTGFSLSVGFEF